MRLSDAIEMGRVLVRPYAGMILYTPYEIEMGCALGMAGRAANVYREGQTVNGTAMSDIWREWPWTILVSFDMPFADVCACAHVCSGRLDGRLLMATQVIAHLFDQHVCGHEMTLDQLIEWVRGVEPREDAAGASEPDAGALTPDDLRETGVEALAVLR